MIQLHYAQVKKVKDSLFFQVTERGDKTDLSAKTVFVYSNELRTLSIFLVADIL